MTLSKIIIACMLFSAAQVTFAVHAASVQSVESALKIFKDSFGASPPFYYAIIG